MVGAFIKEKAPIEPFSVHCEIREGSLTTLANTEAVNCVYCLCRPGHWSGQYSVPTNGWR